MFWTGSTKSAGNKSSDFSNVQTKNKYHNSCNCIENLVFNNSFTQKYLETTYKVKSIYYTEKKKRDEGMIKCNTCYWQTLPNLQYDSKALFRQIGFIRWDCTDQRHSTEVYTIVVRQIVFSDFVEHCCICKIIRTTVFFPLSQLLIHS